MPDRLKGKVVAITGGNQGIGLGIAQRFLTEGAVVSICYLSDKVGTDKTVQELNAHGKAIAVQADVSKLADGLRFVEETASQLGKIDILINNAGVERRAEFWNVTEADYDFVVNVNMKGLFFITQAFVKHQMDHKAKGGKIINISSVHEELPFPHFAAYCVSKGGVKMLTRDLSIELAPLGITINSVAPGAIETPINKALMNDPQKLKDLLENIPLNRLGTPEDVASVAVFLASDESSYITGTTVFVDGGLLWNYQEQ